MADHADWLEYPLSGTNGGHTLIDCSDLATVQELNWRLHTNGYASTEVRQDGRRRRLYLHRVLLAAPPGIEVDHANRDRLDNRRSNLRLATRRQQTANQSIRSNNSSGFRGVSMNRKRGKWQAHIRIHGKSVSLGAAFTSPDEAARAYDAAAVQVFGDFANLNFPEEHDRAA